MRGNKTCYFPSQILIFDTETTQKKVSNNQTQHRYQMAWACHIKYKSDYKNGEKISWKFFNTKNKINKYIIEFATPKKPLYVFSANIWFDMRIIDITKKLVKQKWRCKSKFVHGLSQQFVWSKDDKKIIFLNFNNWFRASVKQIGKQIGLEKKDVNFDTDSWLEIKDYCYRDTEILVEAWKGWKKFILDNDLGGFGRTLPAQALNAYQHRFMTHPIYIHNNKRAIRLERKCYKGGWTECFYIGKLPKGKYRKIDINSSYPTVMRSKMYPTKLINVISNPTKKQLQTALNKYCVCASVIIDTKETPYMIKRSVIIDKETGKLSVSSYRDTIPSTAVNIHPTGRFLTFLCSGSLQYALDHKEIKKVLLMSIYKRANIFTDYIDFFYSKKLQYQKEGNKIYREVSKLFMNSLSGKFGQKSTETIRQINTNIHNMEKYKIIDLDTREQISVDKYGGQETWTLAKEQEGINSFPAIIAHVTDYARISIHQDMQKIGKKNFYYCDTDSLIVNERGYKKIKSKLHPERLGAYTIEQIASRVHIHCPKDYLIGNKKKIKGISKSAHKLSADKYRQMQWPGFNSDMENTLKRPYRTGTITKQLKRQFKQGVISKSGHVQPFRLAEKF